MNLFSEDKRFEGLQHKTGLFMLLAAALVTVVILTTLIRHDVFTQTSQLYFFAHSGQGINKGMAVQLSGFKIGAVEAMELEPNSTVKVQLVVKSEYVRLIKQDSVARLAREGLIGATTVEIVPGSERSRPVANNGVLTFERASDFAEIADDLRSQIKPILSDVKQITTIISDPAGDVRQSIKNVREATALLATTAQQLGGMARQIGAIAREAEPKVNAILGKADAAMTNANSAIAILDQHLPELFLKLDRSLTNIETVTSDVKRVSSIMADELPPIITDTRATMEDTRDIVEGSKRAWPIRNFVSPAREKTLPVDSYDDEPTPAK